MRVVPVSRPVFLLTLVAIVCALIGRAALQTRVAAYRPEFSADLLADLSYLAVPCILAVLLIPAWRAQPGLLRAWYPRHGIDRRRAVEAVVVGLLLRLAWWAEATFSAALGTWLDPDGAAEAVFRFAPGCSSWLLILSGLVAMAMFAPLVEETTSRGMAVGYLQRFGPAVALVASALFFMFLHRLDSWQTAFVGGLLLAWIYQRTGSLWAGTLVHATYNALAIFDWRCISIRWYPPPDAGLVMTAGTLLLLLIAGIVVLVRRWHPGADMAPG